MRGERIDLNADVGEEMGDDDQLLDIVSSANIACGLHAGSPRVMARVCTWAVERGVAVGAHVSYDDRASFGRAAREVAPAVLRQQVADQVGALADAARAAGLEVSYLKPHGALYHRVAVDEEQAAAVLAGAGTLPVLAMPGSRLLEMARALDRGAATEGFPDRGYTADGLLLDRQAPGAVLTDAAAVAEQAVNLADGVDSLCLHGDTPNAVAHARAVRRRLEQVGWTVRRRF